VRHASFGRDAPGAEAPRSAAAVADLLTHDRRIGTEPPAVAECDLLRRQTAADRGWKLEYSERTGTSASARGSRPEEESSGNARREDRRARSNPAGGFSRSIALTASHDAQRRNVDGAIDARRASPRQNLNSGRRVADPIAVAAKTKRRQSVGGEYRISDTMATRALAASVVAPTRIRPSGWVDVNGTCGRCDRSAPAENGRLDGSVAA